MSTIQRITKWVKQRNFADSTGYSLKAITRKRQDGIWLENVHWKKAPDGNILINTIEFDNWVDNGS